MKVIGFPYGKGSLQIKEGCLWKRLFVKVMGFPYGQGSLQIKGGCLWKKLFVKASPFGEDSLQSYVVMEEVLCKGIALLKRLLCKGNVVSLWKRVLANKRGLFMEKAVCKGCL